MVSSLRLYSFLLLSTMTFTLPACNPFANSSGGDDSGLALLALAGLGSGGRVEETRPYRWRTVSVVGSERRIHVYDWNFDRIVSQSNPDAGDIANVDSLYGSSSGRYAYAKVGSDFEIVDSTMNLSPHGDHFHYDRENGFIKVRKDRFASPSLDTPSNTTAHSVRSKSGWVSFLWKGNSEHSSIVRFVQEKRMGEEPTGIPVWAGPTLGNAVSGEAILISGWTDLVALVPSASTGDTPTQFQVYRANTTTRNSEKVITAISGWTKLTSFGFSGDISCPSYNGMAATQIPSPNAVFTDLENSYSKIHYVVISCGTNLTIVTHNDDNGNTSLSTLPTGGLNLRNIQPLFQNDNIERGSRDATPLFLANSGSGVGNEVRMIDPRASSLGIRTISTVPYPSHLLGSDTRNGSEFYVVSDSGFIHTYDSNTGNQIRRMSSRVPAGELGNAKFYGTWFGTALMTHGDRIREYNVRENFSAREVSIGGAIHGMSLKGFFGPGANFDGPAHGSVRSKKISE